MPGDLKYRDINGDGAITSEDKVMLSPYGSTPRIQYGFGISVTWKKLDASVFFNGSAKRKIMLDPSSMQPFNQSWTADRNLMQWIADGYWKEGADNSKAVWPRLATAQAQQENQQAEAAQSETPVVAPIVEKPVSQTTVVDNTDNAAVRSESVTLVSGAGLKNYSVVVGSFSLKANAEGLQGTLKSAGYDAQIVYNPSNNFYRVVAATFDLKSDAVSSRDQFRSKYPDAWLLFKK